MRYKTRPPLPHAEDFVSALNACWEAKRNEKLKPAYIDLFADWWERCYEYGRQAGIKEAYNLVKHPNVQHAGILIKEQLLK